MGGAPAGKAAKKKAAAGHEARQPPVTAETSGYY